MDHKSILSSWFGLGLCMFILQYPFQYLFSLIGMIQMQSLAIAIAGLTAAMIFTYYFYRRTMSPLFKIYAMLTSFILSMLMAAIFVLSSSELRAAIKQIFSSLFIQGDLRSALVAGSLMIVGLLIQFGIWYLFITLGNKQMVNAIHKQSQ